MCKHIWLLIEKDKKMKDKEERKVVHSEETLHQRKQDKLQRQVDQHEGKLLSNNHQRLHTSKDVNEVTKHVKQGNKECHH